MNDTAGQTGAAARPIDSRAEPSVAALERALLDLIEHATDPDIQVEASRLMICIADREDAVDAGEVALLRTGIAALSGKTGNVRVAKFVRNRLEIERRNRNRGFIPWLSRKLGDSAVYAMLVGAIVSAAVWGIAFLAVLAIGAYFNKEVGTDFILPPREASPLAFAAFVGGLVSLLSRVNKFAELYVFDPVLIFVNSLLKPLLATVLAITVYAIIKSGLVQISGIEFDYVEGGYRYIFWAFGFVAGFSERLAGDFIARAESVVGRPRQDAPAPQRDKG